MKVIVNPRRPPFGLSLGAVFAPPSCTVMWLCRVREPALSVTGLGSIARSSGWASNTGRFW